MTTEQKYRDNTQDEWVSSMGYTLVGEDTGEAVSCVTCGKEVRLHFNGGELDRKECCGNVYRQFPRGYDVWVLPKGKRSSE